MTRLRADGLLLLAALIWGSAFVAQKIGNDSMPPVMFCGVRFFLAMLVLAPLAWVEAKRNPAKISRRDLGIGALVGFTLFIGITMQQIALLTATATDGGFLTALYVLFVPFVAWIVQGIRPRPTILFACVMALSGAWLLAGHSMNSAGITEGWTRGDVLLLSSDVIWAFNIVLISKFLAHARRPFFLCFMQYGICGVLGIAAGLAFEPVTWGGMTTALPAILYTGLLSSGVAYTSQVVAQRHTPAAEASLIMSLEGVFAALAGAFMLQERLTFLAMIGCGLILASILMVEIGPMMRRR